MEIPPISLDRSLKPGTARADETRRDVNRRDSFPRPRWRCRRGTEITSCRRVICHENGLIIQEHGAISNVRDYRREPVGDELNTDRSEQIPARQLRGLVGSSN